MKEKMPSDNETVILDYFTKQNRPFSTNDVVTGLRGELTKSVVQKGIDALVSNGKLVEKVVGKQHIYVVDQAQMVTLSDSELRQLDDQVAGLRATLREKIESTRRLDQETKVLKSAPTTEGAKSELASLEKLLSNAEDRLNKLKSSTGPVISPKEREKISKEFKSFVREWRKRKGIVMEMANTILESYPKSRKDFYEDVGIEDDGDLKIPKT